jgi:hypothetical protein
MAKNNKKAKELLAADRTNTSTAEVASATVGRTRKGRDSFTRVQNPIKVMDTQSRQWNRYGP